ncbi:hypothetical protein [Pandoraea sputorum]|uniref:Uncharacterized protein n=1 Tax=Pandoraea sputorum TaxID=93222 RepID=A0A5E5BES1_9BURK|nr:hypothetical protein [Pandoraea sputorum]VVE82870.1 hypothetical protein PSP31121_04009 [Pandoraea sputorum]
MSEQQKSWVSFFLTTSLEAAFFVAWKGFDVQAAGNVLMFWIWFISILVILAYFATTPQTPKAYSGARTVLSVISMIAITGALAWFGHFVTAAFYIFGQICAWDYIKRGRKNARDAEGNVA